MKLRIKNLAHWAADGPSYWLRWLQRPPAYGAALPCRGAAVVCSTNITTGFQVNHQLLTAVLIVREQFIFSF